jgi:fumarate hydratase subunit beta
MDPYVPELAAHGMQGMIGKGRRSAAVKEAIQKYHMVYFVAGGGAGALLSHSIIKREPVAFPELLAEAITRITVKDFPCFVGIDTEGHDIYDLD